MEHEWDPNVLFAEPAPPQRIYGDDTLELFALVDAEDYLWACQHRWHVRYDKRGKKPYLVRSAHYRENGVRVHRTLWLHVEVMKRIAPRTSVWHTIADHRDGDSLNCRRANLRWATPSENAKNRRK